MNNEPWAVYHSIQKSALIKYQSRSKTTSIFEKRVARETCKLGGATTCSCYDHRIQKILVFNSFTDLAKHIDSCGASVGKAIDGGRQCKGFDVWLGGIGDKPEKIRAVQLKGISALIDGEWVYFKINKFFSRYIKCERQIKSIKYKAKKLGIEWIQGRHSKAVKEVGE